jgi:hypothetical protein
MTLSGIEPENFRFVAQQINHCATAVSTALLTIRLDFTDYTRRNVFTMVGRDNGWS